MSWATRFIAATVVLAAGLASAQTPKADVSPTFRVGETFKECPDCPDMVVIPSGAFVMGSPTSEIGHRADETPRDGPVNIRSLAVGKFPVTFAQWDACVAGGGCGGRRPADEGRGRGNLPVINVDWDDAQAYAKWMSAKTGKKYRMLSEAEWEFGARAGAATTYAWGDKASHSYANYGTD